MRTNADIKVMRKKKEMTKEEFLAFLDKGLSFKYKMYKNRNEIYD